MSRKYDLKNSPKRKYGLTKKQMKDQGWTPPGEEPPICACGCGIKVTFDYNHMRWCKFISGHNKSMLGRKHSQNTKDAISKTRSKRLAEGKIVTWNKGLTKETDARVKLNGIHTSEGMIHNGSQKGENNSMYGTRGPFHGKAHSATTKFKMSIKRRLYKRRHPEWNKGPNNPKWSGGNSIEYPEEWNKRLKKSIRKRDTFTCQFCGDNNFNKKLILDVHHIDEDKTNCAEDNLITVCRYCHALFHQSPKSLVNKLISLGRLGNLRKVYPSVG